MAGPAAAYRLSMMLKEAGHLNLAHYVVDFRDEFEEKVVDYFC